MNPHASGRPRLLPSVLLGLALLCGPRLAAEEPAFEAAWKTRGDRLVADLEVLVASAQKSRLFRSRDESCILILRFQPDHESARKYLKYKRGDDGTWQRKAHYKAPQNMGSSGAWREEARAVVDAFSDDAQTLLTRHAGSMSPLSRSRAIADLVAVAPHRKDVRTRNGERRTAEGTWVLAETVEAMSRRRALRVAARVAQATVKEPERVRPSALENRIRLGWAQILQGPRVRMLGTVTRKELGKSQRASEASLDVFAKAFDLPRQTTKGLVIYLLATAEEKATLLANHPNGTPLWRKQSKARSSSWVPKSKMVYVASKDPVRRLEWCTRQPIAALLGWRFGITTKHGWAFEGMGLYVSHLVTGTRGTYFVRTTNYGGKTPAKAGALWKRLRASGADWLAEARTVLASSEPPDLRLLLGKGTDTMTVEELLYGYAVAAYLLEGRPGKAAPLLRALGKSGMHPEQAVLGILGTDVEGLAVRIRRWLEETKDL